MPSNAIPPNQNPTNSSTDSAPRDTRQVRRSTVGAAHNIALMTAHLQSLGVNSSYVLADDGARTHNSRPSSNAGIEGQRPAAPSRWNSVITNRSSTALQSALNQQDTLPSLPPRGRPRSEATADLELNILEAMRDSLSKNSKQ